MPGASDIRIVPSYVPSIRSLGDVGSGLFVPLAANGCNISGDGNFVDTGKSGFYQSSTVPDSSSSVGVVHWIGFPDRLNGFLGEV